MDLVSLIKSFSTGTYVVTRTTGNTFTRGIADAPATTTINVVASVQPAFGRDLLRLPEGRRTNETRVLFTTTQLLTGDQGQSGQADTVVIDGDVWEVQHVETWRQTDLAIAYRCIVQAATPRSS